MSSSTLSSTERFLLLLLTACLVVALSMGIRQAFGIFLRPITLQLELSREAFGFALALQNLLWGLAQPFTGLLADRIGSRKVMILGGVLYAVGLLLASSSQDAVSLSLTLGVIMGLSLSCVTFAVVLGAVGRSVAPAQRSLALGVVTAGGSLGMFLCIPGAQALISEFGWIHTFWIFAATALLIPLMALLMPLSDDNVSNHSVQDTQTVNDALREAWQHRSYWLLNGGFLVCGFHVMFIAVHLPVYLTDQAISPMTAAAALALIGFANIIGSYACGWLGAHYPQKYLLSSIYLVRAVVISAFFLLPLTPASSLVFAFVIGLLWLGTVPLTSGLVATFFGTRYFAMLFGIVFLSHQVGSFLGAWLGGWVFEHFGSYDTIWIASIILGLLSALLHLPIHEQPVKRLQTA